MSTAKNSDYVRPRPSRRSVEAVDDLAYDDAYATVKRNAYEKAQAERQDQTKPQKRSWRNLRRDDTQLHNDLPYGQYLSMSDQRKAIFTRRERHNRLGSAALIIGILAVLAIVVAIFCLFMAAAHA